MKRVKVILIAMVCLLCFSLSGCKKHVHNYVDGKCDCGDFIIPEYDVIFKDADGNILKTEKVQRYQAATAPTAPEKEGYEFKGWSADFSKVTGNLEVTALYEEIIVMEYTIKFNANGGTLDANEIVYTDYTKVELPTPTRENYVFLGWYVRNELVEKIEKNGNYNLKAEWEGEAYEIFYEIEGGELVGSYEDAYNYGTTYVLPVPEKLDHQFEGWYESSDFTGEPITKIEAGRTGGVKVYAKWRKMNPVVTYNLNGGNWQYSSRDEVVNDFLKDAMAWGGKSSKPNGMVQGAGDTSVGFANVFSAIYGLFLDEAYGPKWAWLKNYIISVTTAASASELSKGTEAYWRYSLGAFLFEEYRSTYPITADYTIDQNANGFWDTLSNSSKNVVEVDAEGNLSTPKKIYYVFEGWYLNPEFTGETVTNVTSSCEVYAKWVEEVAVESIQISNKIPELNRFDEYQLTWELYPGNAAIKSVEFRSSDESIATVDPKGLVTCHNNGTVTITIISLSPGGASDDFTIDISSPDHFDISYETVSYVKPNESINLVASYIYRDGSNGTIAWKSLNESIASVDTNGKVTGKAEGNATIRSYVKDDESRYIDFVVTVLPENISDELQLVLDSHESNIFTRYNLGIGAGVPVYYADILGSVNKLLFNYDYEWNTTHLEGVMANGKHSAGLGTSEYPVEFITVHYTAGMTKGSDAEATAIFFKGASASAHFCTGNDGIFHCVELDERGWHAGDGLDTKFEWFNTGIKYNENDPKYPTWGISKNAMFTLNGQETNIKVPYKEQRGSEGYVTDEKWLNDQGFAFKVEDGYYYMGKTWWCYSNVWEGRICSKGGNNNSIGIETAVDEGSDLWYTWQITAQLVADLMLRYDLDITRVVGHHFFAAKDCPQPLLENDLEIWWEFIEIVEAEYERMKEHQDENYKFEVTSGSNIVNEHGRVTEQPDYSQVITYKVTLSDGTAIELATAIPGIYTK